MLQSLRPLLTKILNPIAKNINVNPNIVTVISPFAALIAAYGFANKLLILGCLAILLSGQEYWNGLTFPFPWDLPDPGLNPHLLHCRQDGSPCVAERKRWK